MAAAQVKSAKLAGTSVSTVDAVATVDKSRKNWSVALINRDPSKSVVSILTMNGVPLDGTHKAMLLAAESTESFNDIEHPARMAPREIDLSFRQGLVDLPPHSLVIVHIPSK